MVRNIRPLRDRMTSPPLHALHLYFSLAVAHTSHPPAFFPSVFTASSQYNFMPLPHSHRNNRTAFFLHCNLRHLSPQTNPIQDSHRHKPDAHSLKYIQSNTSQNATCVSKAGMNIRICKAGQQLCKYSDLKQTRIIATHVSNPLCQQETQEYQFVLLTPRH